MPSRSGSDITNEDLQKTWSQLSKDFYHLRTASLPEETWINSFQRFLQIIDGKTGQKDIDTESSLWLNRAKRLRELDNAVSKALPWPQRLTELQAGLANELNKFQADKQAAALKKEWEGKDGRSLLKAVESELRKLKFVFFLKYAEPK